MIVILTALQMEYQALQRHLIDLSTYNHAAGTLFETGVLAGQPGKHIAIAVIGEGNTSAATLTERAISEFQPAAVLFVGIAGALCDWLNIGDVVVATQIYDYHGGRSDDDAFRARPRVWSVSHRLEQIARLVDRIGTWKSATKSSPSVHFNPIAAGEILFNSRISDQARHLKDHYNDAVAVEKESAGFAQAAHLNFATPTITIRGISDYANGTKDATDQTGAPQLAADNAAAFAMSFIAELDEASGQPNPNPSGGKDQSPARFGTISITTSDHAQVGQVIGEIHGGAQFGSPVAKTPPIHLDDVAAAVFAHYRRGLLDDHTFIQGMLALDNARVQQSSSISAEPRRREEIARRLEELFGHQPELRSLIARFRFGESSR